MPRLFDFTYHLGLDRRLGNKLAVARFNLFSGNSRAGGAEACVDTLIEFLLGQFPSAEYEVFLDLHEGALPEPLSEAWPSDVIPAGVTKWYQDSLKASVSLSEPKGFEAVRDAAAGPLVDGVVFFRIRKHRDGRGGSVDREGWAIGAIPDRTEDAYVALLPLFHAVGSLECQSCFLTVMSRSDTLDRLGTAAAESLDAHWPDRLQRPG